MKGSASITQQALVEHLRGAPWREWDHRLPEDVTTAPSMVSDEERRMLAYLGAEIFDPAGCIVELGALFGGSALCLAHGASLHHDDFKMHVYDFFSPIRRHVQRYLIDQGHPDPGPDTLPFAERLLSRHQRSVLFHKGDLLDASWSGPPISILHVDAAKSTDLSAFIAHEFFTNLLPGHSVVVMQDYLMQGHPWCIHMMDVLSDHFEFAGATEVNAALFVCRQRLEAGSPLLAAISNPSDDDLIVSVQRATRNLQDDQHIQQMAKHIAFIVDNPGGRHVSEFPIRNLGADRLRSLTKEYGLDTNSSRPWWKFWA